MLRDLRLPTNSLGKSWYNHMQICNVKWSYPKPDFVKKCLSLETCPFTFFFGVCDLSGLVHPKNLRILWTRAMEAPEGNDILETALRETLPKYPKADGVVVDRACSFLPCACRIKAFNQVKYWSVDLFHAHGHTKDCPCNPLYRRRLKSRFESVNTSACEQVFSWFRGYARVLNEATPSRHAFKVLYFCKLHNQAVDAKDTSYLNPYSRSAKKGKRPYQCGSKKSAMKKPAAKASHTGVAKKPAAKVSHTGVAKKPATKKAFLKR